MGGSEELHVKSNWNYLPNPLLSSYQHSHSGLQPFYTPLWNINILPRTKTESLSLYSAGYKNESSSNGQAGTQCLTHSFSPSLLTTTPMESPPPQGIQFYKHLLCYHGLMPGMHSYLKLVLTLKELTVIYRVPDKDNSYYLEISSLHTTIEAHAI